jgi:hypothetical protein
MKKISVLVLLLVLFCAQQVFAAWTISDSLSVSRDRKVSWVTISATSDGTDPAAVDLTSYLTAAQINQFLKGTFLTLVETDPGDPAPATWAVTISSDLGGSNLTLTGLSTSATEIFSGSRDLDAFYVMKDNLKIDFGDIGDNGDKVVVRLQFTRP